jgi:AcrR family transcriptional regulator
VTRKQFQITKTASNLFRRHGVRRVSVEEVCREAGVSKATFYKYFPNKIALVKSILDTMTDRALARTQEIIEMDAPFEEKARLLVDDRLEGIRRMGDDFIRDFYDADAEIAELVEEVTERSHRTFTDFLVEAQRRGDLRSDVRPEFVLRVLDKLNELAADETLRPYYDDYVSMTKEVTDFLFHGLLGPR